MTTQSRTRSSGKLPTITPAANACGSVITDVDIRSVDDETLTFLKQAVADRLVVCLRSQHDAHPEDEIAFARRWGTLEPHPYVPPIDGFPEIMEIHNPHPITQKWHSDFTFAKEPPAYAFLLARTVPTVGGDTMFANMYAAWDALSDGLKETLKGLRGVHQATSMAEKMGMDKGELTQAHPVVRVHPVTGRRSLFVNGDYVDRFDGWSVEESRPLLEFLFQHCSSWEFTYRHRWLPGDLLIWDNRCAQHAVIGDTDGEPRSLHRVTVAGEVPVPG